MQKIEISKVGPILRNGNLILVSSTDGRSLICDAGNEKAINKLRSFIAPSTKREFRILVDNDARLNRHVHEVPSIAWDILDSADEPLILILPKGLNVSDNALDRDGSIPIQMVKESDEKKLVQRANCPLAAILLRDDQDTESFSSIEYIINLPASFLQSSPNKKAPIISLGSNNEVKILRE